MPALVPSLSVLKRPQGRQSEDSNPCFRPGPLSAWAQWRTRRRGARGGGTRTSQGRTDDDYDRTGGFQVGRCRALRRGERSGTSYFLKGTLSTHSKHQPSRQETCQSSVRHCLASRTAGRSSAYNWGSVATNFPFNVVAAIILEQALSSSR